MTPALLTGAGFGLGLVLIWRGLRPSRQPLAAALARGQYRVASSGPDFGSAGDGMLVRAGRPLAGVMASLGLEPKTLGTDLAITGRSLHRHLAEKAALAMFGLALAPATAGVMALGGVGLPWVVPAWAALGFAAAGFFAPDFGVRAEAAARRRDFRHALGAFLDLTVVALAGGAGVEGALEDAAGVGHGPAFTRIRHALAAARVRRETPWAALGRLGAELGIPELVELAATVGLAGTEGARVRASLGAKAESLRSHQLAEAESEAQAASERMSLPVVLLFCGFLIFIGFPAMARVLSGF